MLIASTGINSHPGIGVVPVPAPVAVSLDGLQIPFIGSQTTFKYEFLATIKSTNACIGMEHRKSVESGKVMRGR
jgi:hypothetical protein